MSRAQGSEKRKRQIILTARVDADEARIVQEKARAFGGVSALFRTAVLNERPRPSRLDHEAIARVLAEMGRLRSELNKNGSNLNQLTHYANMSRTLEGSIQVVLQEHQAIVSDMMELRLIIMQALGYERDRKPPDHKPPDHDDV